MKNITRSYIELYEFFEPKEEWIEEVDRYFLLVWVSQREEINFVLMDMSHWDYINKCVNDDECDMIDYVYEHKADSMHVDSYAHRNWFKNKNIEKVIYLTDTLF